MSKQPKQPTLPKNDAGQRDKWAWPGGYPIFYIVADMETLCSACANGENGSEAAREDLDPECPDDDQWRIVAAEINWEDPDLTCSHCNKRIESAYAEPDKIAPAAEQPDAKQPPH